MSWNYTSKPVSTFWAEVSVPSGLHVLLECFPRSGDPGLGSGRLWSWNFRQRGIRRTIATKIAVDGGRRRSGSSQPLQRSLGTAIQVTNRVYQPALHGRFSLHENRRPHRLSRKPGKGKGQPSPISGIGIGMAAMLDAAGDLKVRHGGILAWGRRG